MCLPSRVIPAVTFALAVAIQLQRAGVAQNQGAAQRRSGQDRADHSGRKRGDDHGENAAAAVVAVHWEIAAVQARKVVGLDVASVGFRFGVCVAGELEHSAAEEHIAAQGASWHEAADLWGCHVVSDQGDIARAGVLKEVPRV